MSRTVHVALDSFAVGLKIQHIDPALKERFMEVVGEAPRRKIAVLHDLNRTALTIESVYLIYQNFLGTLRLSCSIVTARISGQLFCHHPIRKTFEVRPISFINLAVVELDVPYDSSQVAAYGDAFTAWTEEKFKGVIKRLSQVYLVLLICADSGGQLVRAGGVPRPRTGALRPQVVAHALLPADI